MLKLVKSKTSLLTALLFAIPLSLQATVVEIRTSLGEIQVNLFDSRTPGTVDNFLSYVNAGAYANNVVHRSVPDFVVQAGGFTFNGDFPIVRVETDPAIANEPVLSNVRGTIAMAKGSDPDSATSQWFINTANNANSLDVASNAGGFTVFGQVLGNGMDIVDQINSLETRTVSSLRDFPLRDIIEGGALTADNLVLISDIVVIDAATNTNSGLNPVPNTLINPGTPGSGGGADSGSGSGGGGTATTLLWFALFFVLFRKIGLSELDKS